MSSVNQPDSFFKRTSKSWVSETLLSTFNEIGFDELLEEGLELVRSRRVLDFGVSKGACSARVFGETGAPVLVQVNLETITDEGWDKIYETLSDKSLFLASFLAGELPTELEAGFSDAGEALFPVSGKEFKVQIDGKNKRKLCPMSAAVIYKFLDALTENPFLYIVFRGRGREETIVEIRRKRSLKNQQEASASGVHIQQVHADHANEVPLDDDFWKSAESLQDLRYNIKADELPAAILRHLDPIPLGGLEEEIERNLEDAYEHVTTRAQAYGLGL